MKVPLCSSTCKKFRNLPSKWSGHSQFSLCAHSTLKKWSVVKKGIQRLALGAGWKMIFTVNGFTTRVSRWAPPHSHSQSSYPPQWRGYPWCATRLIPSSGNFTGSDGVDDIGCSLPCNRPASRMALMSSHFPVNWASSVLPRALVGTTLVRRLAHQDIPRVCMFSGRGRLLHT